MPFQERPLLLWGIAGINQFQPPIEHHLQGNNVFPMQYLVVILQLSVRPCILTELIAILCILSLLPSIVSMVIEISNSSQKLT